MLVDMFLFNNELEMLEFRLKMLAPVVDAFVIFQSNKTFSGNPKPLYINLDSALIAPWRDKISIISQTSVCADSPAVAPPSAYDPSHPCWHNEYVQRGSMGDYAARLPDDAYVLLGDVDEIPTREAIKVLRCRTPAVPVVFHQFFLYYNLSTLRDEIWQGTIYTPVSVLKATGAQAMRNRRVSYDIGIARSGWHLSFFGGPDAISKKISDFSHQEYNNPDYNNKTLIEAAVRERKDLFRRGVPARKVGPEFYPDYFRDSVPSPQWWGLDKQ